MAVLKNKQREQEDEERLSVRVWYSSERFSVFVFLKRLNQTQCTNQDQSANKASRGWLHWEQVFTHPSLGLYIAVPPAFFHEITDLT